MQCDKRDVGEIVEDLRQRTESGVGSVEAFLETLGDEEMAELCNNFGLMCGRTRTSSLHRIMSYCVRVFGDKTEETEEPGKSEKSEECLGCENTEGVNETGERKPEGKPSKKKISSKVGEYIRGVVPASTKQTPRKNLVEKIDPSSALARRLSYNPAPKPNTKA
ncbi:MAG: uncharacterized protein A8A55_2038 [Amphiamblys sp. WSBS2006]|nr:MAG: uncharacterized protein A8A55_2038 [Amphiamblys sp. WSBS2006]